MDTHKCKYCGEEYSEELEKCPACGEPRDSGGRRSREPISNTPPWVQTLLLVLGGLAIVGVAIYIVYSLGVFGGGDGGPDAVPPSTPVSESPSLNVEPPPTPETPVVTETPEPTPEPTPNIPVNSITLSAEDISFFGRGEGTQLTATVDPASAAPYVVWESSNGKIASVDEFGKVTALSGGTVNITASVGGKTAKCIVRVNMEITGELIDMNIEDISLFSAGETTRLNVTTELTEDELNALVWESDKPEVAVVDSNGVVTAVSSGKANITAKTGDKIAACIVRVNLASTAGLGTGAQLRLNHSDVTLFNPGEFVQLKVLSDGEFNTAGITWSSKDSSKATVDSTGLVTAVSNGTVKISATVDGVTLSCIVRVGG